MITASPQDTYDHIFGSGATSYSWWRGLKTEDIDLETFKVEDGWSVLVTCEDGNDGRRSVVVDHHAIMRYARRLISEPPQYAGDAVIRECKHLLFNAEETDFDADSADQLLQFIVLGEIVFG
jgi:hypothetical protein